MTKLAIAKFAINVVVGIGVSKVINDVIDNNVNVENTEDKIKVYIGSAVIGSMIAERASKHINFKIDNIASVWQNRKAVETTTEVVEEVAEAATA